MGARSRDPKSAPASLGWRLLWFVALWLMGVLTVAAVSYGLRLWIARA